MPLRSPAWQHICRLCLRQSSPIPRSGSLACRCCRSRATSPPDRLDGIQTNFARLGNFSEWFTRRFERAPEATAVSTGQVRLSYRELARRSSAIAHRLTLEGIGPDVVVALLAERDANLLAAMIAVQRVGGAFLCLEPALPVEGWRKSFSPAVHR